MEEMNEFEMKPRGTFWRDWGVYGALALCLAIIGAAVALTSLPEKEEARVLTTQSPATQAPQQAALPEELVLPKATGLPVIRILPAASDEPAPEQAANRLHAPLRAPSWL